MFYLTGSNTKVKKYFVIHCNEFPQSTKNHIMDAKERNQQESGFGQPPKTSQKRNEELT